MSHIFEEPENYEGSSDDGQEDNQAPNSTTYGRSNWRGDTTYDRSNGRGNPYSSPSEMFSEAEGFTIKNGNFEAKDGSKMFGKTREFTIDGGRFNSTGYDYNLHRNDPNVNSTGYNYDWHRNDPNVARSEIFTGSSGHTINDGEFVATGNSRAFANTSNYVINGGTFVAHASIYNQAPINYGIAQGNAPPRPYQGQQGYDSRSSPLGYTGNPTQISNEFWQTSRPPAMHTRSSTLNGPFSNYTGSNLIRTAPIPPSYSEGQGYFYNRGEGRFNGGGRRA